MTNWQTEKLANLLEVSIGGIWGEEAGTAEVDVAVVRVTELKAHGRIDPSSAVIRSVTQKQLSSRELQEGDLLLEKSGGGPNSPVGRVGYFSQGDTRTVCSNFMQLMRPDSTKILPKFLFYFLDGFHSNGGTIAMQTATTNIRNIKTPQYMDIDVPLPIIAEQKRIVELLEEHISRLDAALADVMQAKLKAAQFRNVYVDDFLTKSDGVICSLGSILKFTSGFAYKSLIWQDKGIPVVKIMNVKHREVNLDGCSFISAEIAESSKNFAVKKGDLLFNMTGATLGAFGFYNLELEARMNQRVGKFVPLNLNQLNLNYLAYFLEAASTQQRIQQLAKGAAQPNISPTDILSLEICLPKFDVQNAIVDELDAGLSKVTQVDQLCSITKVESNALRRSLLQAAFTGQLSKENVSV